MFFWELPLKWKHTSDWPVRSRQMLSPWWPSTHRGLLAVSEEALKLYVDQFINTSSWSHSLDIRVYWPGWSRTIEHINPPPSPPMLLMDIYRESNSCTANGPLVRSAQPLHATRILFYGTFCHSSLGVFLWFVNICYYYKVTSTFTIHSVTYIYLLISDAANKVCRLDQKKPLNNCFTQHGKNNFITTSA